MRVRYTRVRPLFESLYAKPGRTSLPLAGMGYTQPHEGPYRSSLLPTF